ncbi:hypothetical protein HF680_06165 [Brevundimonas sp. WCHBH090558]|mgnify:FL=1|uniref:hypothetical protein n=1 Tax=Brevundimonas huaxiensis TaxID=2725493 RepID=UPI00162339B5|nr:hypothetical protein [Brevundimonas huaxiensis]MBC1182240.1 hypothetical protein [Brevundimonas huaxiensis]
MIRTIGVAAILATAAIASPSAAESWAAFSRSDATVYLVDVDALTPVDGVATTRMARVPARGEATNLSHETEEVIVRCSDGQSRSGATVTYGADGAETDRYSEDTPWEATPAGGIYGAIKSFACEDMRPQTAAFPTIQAFIAGGRGQ